MGQHVHPPNLCSIKSQLAETSGIVIDWVDITHQVLWTECIDLQVFPVHYSFGTLLDCGDLCFWNLLSYDDISEQNQR